MRVWYTILNYNVDKQIRETGDWTTRPSHNALNTSLNGRKPDICMVLQSPYYTVKITKISEKREPVIRFVKE